MIEIRALHFRYPEKDGGTFDLSVARLDIAPGERIALTGRSGSGKTTLINIIAGILPARADVISVAGADYRTLPLAARRKHRLDRIGMVFQRIELVPYLSVRDNILLPAILAGRPDREARARELAAALSIENRLSAKPHQLSTGECQRVGIARALIADPAVILADEPTSHLDRATGDMTLDLLFDAITTKTRRDAPSAALLMATHHEDSLARFDRVIAMDAMDALERMA